MKLRLEDVEKFTIIKIFSDSMKKDPTYDLGFDLCFIKYTNILRPYLHSIFFIEKIIGTF